MQHAKAEKDRWFNSTQGYMQTRLSHPTQLSDPCGWNWTNQSPKQNATVAAGGDVIDKTTQTARDVVETEFAADAVADVLRFYG